MDYMAKLKDLHKRDILVSMISVWFRDRYEYAGKHKVPNLVPIDKWMMRNVTRVMTYHAIINMFPDHSKWNFLNEEHIINGDTLPRKVHAGPITGYVHTISVSGG
jgi:hypothetical protein